MNNVKNWAVLFIQVKLFVPFNHFLLLSICPFFALTSSNSFSASSLDCAYQPCPLVPTFSVVPPSIAVLLIPPTFILRANVFQIGAYLHSLPP